MKVFAKEMWHLLVFAAAFICFNVALKAVFGIWEEWFNDEASLQAALFLTVMQVGLGMLTLKTFEWLHKHVAETRGMKFFKAAVEKHTAGIKAKLAEERKNLEDKIITVGDANKQLHNANLMLADELRLVKAELAETRKPKMIEEHFDDWALDQFLVQLRAKLKRKREEGRAGWVDCQLPVLHDLLIEEVESLNVANMDMVDVANYAAFCWVRDAFPVECAQAAIKPTRTREIMSV